MFYKPLNALIRKMEIARTAVNGGHLAFTPAEDKTDYYRLTYSKNSLFPSGEEDEKLKEDLDLVLRTITRDLGYVIIEPAEVFSKQKLGRYGATIIKWRMVKTAALPNLNKREATVSTWWLAQVAASINSDKAQLDQLHGHHEKSEWQQAKII